MYKKGRREEGKQRRLGRRKENKAKPIYDKK